MTVAHYSQNHSVQLNEAWLVQWSNAERQKLGEHPVAVQNQPDHSMEKHREEVPHKRAVQHYRPSERVWKQKAKAGQWVAQWVSSRPY